MIFLCGIGSKKCKRQFKSLAALLWHIYIEHSRKGKGDPIRTLALKVAATEPPKN